jgi:two-component system, LytTR family, response regulator
MKIRTLIVDDEPLARERLRQLLLADPAIEIIGECGDGIEAVAAIRRDSPELLFLDIQMPELDGFGVLEAISPNPAPVIVFVTAYDQFAVRAFEVHAVDYLLKPFDRQRFQTALACAVDQVRHRKDRALDPRQSALLADLKPAPKPGERLAVKTDGRVVFVKISEIDWIEAAHNYVEIHVGQELHMLRETLNAIETRIPPEKFVRISRSVIVNLERVKELQPLFHGEYCVTLHNGARLTWSRRYRDNLRRLGLE